MGEKIVLTRGRACVVRHEENFKNTNLSILSSLS